MLLQIDIDPFAAIVGYAGALVGASYALWALLWKTKVWNAPAGVLPGQLRGLIGAVIGVAMVLIYLNIEPANAGEYQKWMLVFLLTGVFGFLLFFSLVRGLTHQIVIAVSARTTKTEEIIGGLWLTHEARKQKRKIKLSNQKLLEGAAFDQDLIWPRFSREIAKNLIVVAYLLAVTGGTLGITSGAFLMQIAQTGKAPVEVFRGQSTAKPTQ